MENIQKLKSELIGSLKLFKTQNKFYSKIKTDEKITKNTFKACEFENIVYNFIPTIKKVYKWEINYNLKEINIHILSFTGKEKHINFKFEGGISIVNYLKYLDN